MIGTNATPLASGPHPIAVKLDDDSLDQEAGVAAGRAQASGRAAVGLGAFVTNRLAALRLAARTAGAEAPVMGELAIFQRSGGRRRDDEQGSTYSFSIVYS